MAYDELAPSIRIVVEGKDVSQAIKSFDVAALVEDCEVEQAIDMADAIKLKLINPPVDRPKTGRTGDLLLVDNPVFLPGNQIEIWMGYSGNERYVGGGVIQRWMPHFPDQGMPTLNIEAYDASILMMDSEDSEKGAKWEDVSHSDIVAELAGKYGFRYQVGEGSNATIRTTPTEKRTIKKAGISDYDFAQSLALLHGYYFKVRRPIVLGKPQPWTLYWGPRPGPDQTKKYTLDYRIISDVDGRVRISDEATLLDFKPEMALKDSVNEVKVYYWDRDTGKWDEVVVKGDTSPGENPKFDGDRRMEREIVSSSSYRFAVGDINVEVVPDRTFPDADSALSYAQSWFKRRRDQFITGEGTLVGLEELDAGQTHALIGVGRQLSGDYEFTTVRHRYSRSGFTTSFFAHKVLS